MINPQWLELPMSLTNFHDPKDVRAIEIRLYFVRDHSDAPQKYSDADVIKMLEYLINIILWSSADGYFSKQSAYRWVLTVHRCLPACFNTRMRRRRSLYKVPTKQYKTPCTTIQFHLQIYRWCIVSEKHKFAEYLEFIYPRELEIKETTETAASSSYLDCYLYIDNGRLTTKLYDKRDDFIFSIVNFPFLSSNILSAPAYGVYVSQLIRYARACSNYQDFIERGKVLTLTTRLLSQRYQKTKLVATLKKFYEMVNAYNVTASQIVCDVFANDEP